MRNQVRTVTEPSQLTANNRVSWRSVVVDPSQLTENKLIASQRFRNSDFASKRGFGQDGSGDSKVFL